LLRRILCRLHLLGVLLHGVHLPHRLLHLLLRLSHLSLLIALLLLVALLARALLHRLRHLLGGLATSLSDSTALEKSPLAMSRCASATGPCSSDGTFSDLSIFSFDCASANFSFRLISSFSASFDWFSALYAVRLACSGSVIGWFSSFSRSALARWIASVF
jgi:hypothetical protein